MGTKRVVSEADKARFWQARASGMTLTEAARIAGIHVNTASKWEIRKKSAMAELAVARAEESASKRKDGGVQARAMRILDVASELPPAIPKDRLCPEAQRGLQDFDFFRSYYLGRVPSPWQVEAAYKIVQYLESEEKEFLVLNVSMTISFELVL